MSCLYLLILKHLLITITIPLESFSMITNTIQYYAKFKSEILLQCNINTDTNLQARYKTYTLLFKFSMHNTNT